MTEEEAFKAMKSGRPVAAKMRVSLDLETFNFRKILEIHYFIDRDGKLRCCAMLQSRVANSVTSVPVEDVEYVI